MKCFRKLSLDYIIILEVAKFKSPRNQWWSYYFKVSASYISFFLPRTSRLICICSFHNLYPWCRCNSMKRNTQGLFRPGLRVGTVTQSCPTLLWPHGLYNPWNSPGQNTGVGKLSLLQDIFAPQRSNLGLLHCRWILHQLNHQGSPRVLEWVAYLFSRGSSWPRNQTGFSVLQADSLPAELPGNWSIIISSSFVGQIKSQSKPNISGTLGNMGIGKGIFLNHDPICYNRFPLLFQFKVLILLPSRQFCFCYSIV